LTLDGLIDFFPLMTAVWLVLEVFYPPDVKESIEKGNPYGYLYLKKVVLPHLKEMGVEEAVLDTLCVNGPRNFFEGV